MKTSEYKDRLRKSINFSSYVALTQSLGSQLNSRKDRFDKSDIIEQAIAIYSNGILEWRDEIGYDLLDTDTNHTVEVKYIEHGIFTTGGKAKSTVKAKIKNSLGDHKGITINKPADFYLFCQSDALVIVSWQTLSNYLVAVSDGIECRIPYHELEIVFGPLDVCSIVTHQVNYKQAKAEMQKQLILEFA